MQEFTLSTSSHDEMVDITAQVRQAAAAGGAASGLCVVYVPHTTAGVTINEGADPAVRHDIIAQLGRIVPEDGGYTHMEGNSAGHIKATMTGSSATILIDGGRLVLGTWQSVYFCEFDGPRTRRFLVEVIEGGPGR